MTEVAEILLPLLSEDGGDPSEQRGLRDCGYWHLDAVARNDHTVLDGITLDVVRFHGTLSILGVCDSSSLII